MVAEPVQASLSFLRAAYLQASGYVLELFPAPDPNVLAPKTLPPTRPLERFFLWTEQHKRAIWAAAGVGLGVGIGAGAFFYSQTRAPPKRRVPKLANGARRDVVLVVGSPTEPLTRLVALDFEKRGFIVYLTILDDKDARYVNQSTLADDVNYLNLHDSPTDAVLRDFKRWLATPVVPFANAAPHRLRLRAVVFAPHMFFPLGPAESVSPASWARVQRLLAVHFELFSAGLADIVRSHSSRVVAVVPTVVSTLCMPYHAPEAVFQAALKSFYATLAHELGPHGVPVTQVRLGNLNVSRGTPLAAVVDAEVRSWPEEMRDAYGALFRRAQARAAVGSGRASRSLRDLHHLLFDLVFARSPPRVVYFGTGARAYEWLVCLFPWAASMAL